MGRRRSSISDGYYAEPAADEIYAGPTHDLLPSSYSSFHAHHHGHSHARRESRASRSIRSFSVDEASDDGYENAEAEATATALSTQAAVGSSSGVGFGATFGPGSSDGGNSPIALAWTPPPPTPQAAFSFFSRDEVLHAEGSSTAAESDSDDGFCSSDEAANDAVWEWGQQDGVEGATNTAGHSTHARGRTRSNASAGASGSRYHHFGQSGSGRAETDDDERASRRSSSPAGASSRRESGGVAQHSLFDGFSDSEPLLTEDGLQQMEFEYTSAVRQQQRYFIVEEDLRIVCAGFRRVRWRRYVYIAACVLSLGLLYLLLRWFPRLRIQWLAKSCPLGRCDCVVIENQWGDLDVVDVAVKRYNHPLSTVFCSDHKHHNDAETVNSSHHHNLHHHHNRHHHHEIDDYVDEDPNLPVLRTITYRFLRFHYNPQRDLFLTNTGWVNPSWATHEGALAGLEGDTQAQREVVFGNNSLQIPCPATSKLLVDEVLHPFYIFQVFSIILWAFDSFLYYATAIFIVSVASIVEALIETRSNFRRLSELIAADTDVRVLRSGFWNTVHSAELLPGDVFEISDPNMSILPCDAILLSGDCIVNESILTGESVPVSKIAANDSALAAYTSRDFSGVVNSFLYGGTRLIRVRKPNATSDDLFSGALAMTVRTGFTTTQGALVRSMLFPKPTSFKFYRDSFLYIGVMAIIAVLGFLISLVSFVEMKLAPGLIITRALDLITIVVPPALPATLTIGTNISLARLRKRHIFCITPSRTNVGGRVDIVAFDKTGTLTEDGLDVMGVHTFDTSSRKFSNLLTSVKSFCNTPLMDILASCHELRALDDGELVGDPLDLKMFEFSGYSFNESEFMGGRSTTSPDNRRKLIVAKQYEFVSKLRRMSVVATVAHGDSRVLLKGAPEIMRSVCQPSSIPDNFDQLYLEYTHRGYRVIACAYKDLSELVSYDREDVEHDLEFCGLIVFENRLKPTTRGVIDTLAQAEIRTVMCTGDNLLTAVSVARECRIIGPNATVFAAHFDENTDDLRWECVDDPSLLLDSETLLPLNARAVANNWCIAVSGDVFGHVMQSGNIHLLEQILLRGAVYARMSPDEKHELVARLQAIDYTVCFCGDGANDVGALKEAEIGVSLSEAEASIAAPFTSRLFEISCVVDVIREGRCALQTSFSCFQFMSLYSAIQFVSVTILYGYGSNLGDFQYLWIDLFLIVPLAMFMAWSDPAPSLCVRRPKAKLVSRRVLVPLIGSAIVFGVFQYMAVHEGHKQPWYSPPEAGNDNNLRSTDNMALFLTSCFQYIMAAVLLCRGLPYRMPVHTNKPFLLTVVVCTSMSLLFVWISPSSWLGRLLDLSYISTRFCFTVLALVVANCIVLYCADHYLFSQLVDTISLFKRKLTPNHRRKRYKELQIAAKAFV